MAMLAVAGSLFVLSLFVVGLKPLTEMQAVTAYLAGPIWSVSPNNQSPYGFLLRLFSVNPFTVPLIDFPILAEILHGALGLVVLGGLAVLVRRDRSAPVQLLTLEYGLVTVAMLLISPAAQPNHYVYLAMPGVAVGASLVAGRPRSRVLLVGLGGLGLYLSMPGLQAWSAGFYRYVTDGPIGPPLLFLTGAHLYALCTLAVLTAVVTQRCRRDAMPRGWLMRVSTNKAPSRRPQPLPFHAAPTRMPTPMVGDVIEVHVSVVIPAFNEETRLTATLDRVLAYLHSQPIAFEVIVVDDGSTDRSPDLVNQVARRDPHVRLIREPHRGKGAAVRSGALHAAGQRVIFCDADLSHPVEDLTRLPALLEGLASPSVVIGSREAQGASRDGEPAFRHGMGRIFNLLVRMLAVPGVADTQCGLKCFARQAAHELFSRQTIDGFGFDVEILFLARKLGYAIVEVPIDWHHVVGSRVDPLRDSVRMFMDVWRIRLNDWRGHYNLPSPGVPADEHSSIERHPSIA
jgi:hypothetical protein